MAENMVPTLGPCPGGLAVSPPLQHVEAFPGVTACGGAVSASSPVGPLGKRFCPTWLQAP